MAHFRERREEHVARFRDTRSDGNTAPIQAFFGCGAGCTGGGRVVQDERAGAVVVAEMLERRIFSGNAIPFRLSSLLRTIFVLELVERRSVYFVVSISLHSSGITIFMSESPSWRILSHRPGDRR